MILFLWFRKKSHQPGGGQVSEIGYLSDHWRGLQSHNSISFTLFVFIIRSESLNQNGFRKFPNNQSGFSFLICDFRYEICDL